MCANANTPGDVLAALAADDNVRARCAVAGTRHAMQAKRRTIEILENHMNMGHIAAGLAAPPAPDTTQGERTAHNAATAAHPNTPGDVLAAMATNPDESVRLRCGRQHQHMGDNVPHPRPTRIDNQRRPPQRNRQQRSSTAAPARPHHRGGRSRRVTGTGAGVFYATPPRRKPRCWTCSTRVEPEYLVTLACDPATPGGVLHRLAQEPYWAVRSAAAQRTDMPPDVLTKLAADSDEDVRLAAAENPRLPADTLHALRAHEDRQMRRRVAGNPSARPDTLAALTDTWSTRLAVMGEPRRAHRNSLRR